MQKDEKQVAEWYNALSGSYDELYGTEQSPKHQAVLEFLGNRRFQVLVDIGCGTGSFLRTAEKTYDYGIGIDLSTKMLQTAITRYTPNTDYVLASASSLPLKNSSIDCAVSISTVKADPNLPNLITDLGRAGRENCLLAITVFEHGTTPESISFITKPIRSKKMSVRETLYFHRLSNTRR